MVWQFNYSINTHMVLARLMATAFCGQERVPLFYMIKMYLVPCPASAGIAAGTVIYFS